MDSLKVVQRIINDHPLDSDTIHIHLDHLLELPSEMGNLINLKTLYIHSNSL